MIWTQIDLVEYRSWFTICFGIESHGLYWRNIRLYSKTMIFMNRGRSRGGRCSGCSWRRGGGRCEGGERCGIYPCNDEFWLNNDDLRSNNDDSYINTGADAALFLIEYTDGFKAALLHGQGEGCIFGGWGEWFIYALRLIRQNRPIYVRKCDWIGWLRWWVPSIRTTCINDAWLWLDTCGW